MHHASLVRGSRRRAYQSGFNWCSACLHCLNCRLVLLSWMWRISLSAWGASSHRGSQASQSSRCSRSKALFRASKGRRLGRIQGLSLFLTPLKARSHSRYAPFQVLACMRDCMCVCVCVCVVCVFQSALQSIQTGAHPCRAHKSDQDKAGVQGQKAYRLCVCVSHQVRLYQRVDSSQGVCRLPHCWIRV